MSSPSAQHLRPAAGPEPQMMMGLYGQPSAYVPHDPPAYPESVQAALPRTSRLAIIALGVGLISLLLAALYLWLLLR